MVFIHVTDWHDHTRVLFGLKVLLVLLIPYSRVIFIEHSLLLDIPYDNDNARYSITSVRNVI
jgi:hypothetical protein